MIRFSILHSKKNMEENPEVTNSSKTFKDEFQFVQNFEFLFFICFSQTFSNGDFQSRIRSFSNKRDAANCKFAELSGQEYNLKVQGFTS